MIKLPRLWGCSAVTETPAEFGVPIHIVTRDIARRLVDRLRESVPDDPTRTPFLARMAARIASLEMQAPRTLAQLDALAEPAAAALLAQLSLARALAPLPMPPMSGSQRDDTGVPRGTVYIAPGVYHAVHREVSDAHGVALTLVQYVPNGPYRLYVGYV